MAINSGVKLVWDMLAGLKQLTDKFFRRYFEATVWILALVLLATMSPVNDHSSLCPLKNVGISFCPGCGLGHSIAWLFRGEIVASFKAHPLGPFAVIVIISRIVHLLRKNVL